MKRLLLAVLLFAPLQAQAGPLVLPSFGGALQSLLAHGVAKVVGDLQTMDTVAGAVNPGSPNPPPYNVWNWQAHQCAGPAIAWLQSMPTKSSVPTPQGPGGILTTIVVAGADLDATQDFISKLTASGIPPAVRAGCDSFVSWVIRSPARLQANANADFVNFLALFQR